MNKEKIKQNAERAIIYLKNIGCSTDEISLVIKEMEASFK